MNYKQTLYIFYSLILGIFIIGVESFTPRGRVGHSSILIGTKLYFFGGVISDALDSNEVFYLDVSQTFDAASPPWTDLTASAKIPFESSWAGMSLVYINDDPTVYLFSGITSSPVTGSDLFISNAFTFNIKTLEWKIPNINGEIPERRRSMNVISDNKGKLYVFGGAADLFVGSRTTQFFNDMVILDTTGLKWLYGSTLNAPTKRDAYSATILANGVIVYIGGVDENAKMIDINQINLYDTNLDSWSVTIAKNTNTIESRRSHSAVLTPDGNIIIYGGEKLGSVPLAFDSVEPDIAILNTRNTPFEWIVPTIPHSDVNKPPPSLSGHTANLVGNYMIVAFGVILPSDLSANRNSKIYIMDIRNYTFGETYLSNSSTKVSTQTQTSTTSTQTSNSEDKETKKTKTVIGILSGVIGIGFLSAIGFLGYKLRKKYKMKQILNIPGS